MLFKGIIIIINTMALFQGGEYVFLFMEDSTMNGVGTWQGFSLLVLWKCLCVCGGFFFSPVFQNLHKLN